MSYNNGPRIVTDNLMLHLDAADSNSYPGYGNKWYDISNYNNHALLLGNYSYNNNEKSLKFNDGNQLDGSGRGILNINYLDPSSHTLELIFRVNQYITLGSTSNVGTHLFSSGRHPSCTYRRHFGTYNNGVNGVVNRAMAFWYVAGEIDGGYGPWIYTNDIYHLTLTIETASKKFYLNGQMQWEDTTTTSAFSFFTNNLWAIANVHCTNVNAGIDSDFFTIRLYNRALTETDILKNFNATKSRYGL